MQYLFLESTLSYDSSGNPIIFSISTTVQITSSPKFVPYFHVLYMCVHCTHRIILQVIWRKHTYRHIFYTRHTIPPNFGKQTVLWTNILVWLLLCSKVWTFSSIQILPVWVLNNFRSSLDTSEKCSIIEYPQICEVYF